MGQLVTNVGRGRAVELHNRVDGNDPANSALILVVLAATGLESDDVLRDKTTLADLVSGTTNEVTNTGYSRKVLTDADLAAPTVDNALDKVTLTFGTQTFGGPNVAAGDSWRKLFVCYDSDTTAGTDANIIPIVGHDLLLNGAAIIPSGAPIVITLPNGYYVSSL